MSPYHPRSAQMMHSQRLFLLVLLFTLTMYVLLQMFGPQINNMPPAYVLIKTYITSEATDGRRLGNLMFNYASMVGIGTKLNMTSVMNADFRLFNIFKLGAIKTMNMENTLGMHQQYEEYGRRACAYDVKVKKLGRMNTHLQGYFQSWKYFNGSENIIRREFEFHEDILDPAKEFIQQHSVTEWHGQKFTRVGIHVRRGDYLEPYYSNYGYTTANKQYFEKAMQYFTEKYDKVQFIICSDDIQWCKENLVANNIVFSQTGSDVIDLAILSLCNHTIMSTGSFGWWGAFLANGTTIYYDYWPRPVSVLEYMVTKPDYFYPYWIPMK